MNAHFILPDVPFESLDEYIAIGGGAGLAAARAVAQEAIIAEIEASGLRGRGGAGFPTGTKWRTVVEHRSDVLVTPVVINAAEGEPGTFKDRQILRFNPYAVLEGALIAAQVIGSNSVTVATKSRFDNDLEALQRAIGEVAAAGWTDHASVDILHGPPEYLYGEETALLEVLAGRPPLPRLAPPWRRGVVDVLLDDIDGDTGSGLAADVAMATSADDNVVPPVLVNNVETFANVPGIISHGASWFRELGTADSPGTVVCTVTGAVERPGVFEVPMGTTMNDLIELAGGPSQGNRITAVLSGVSNAILPASRLDCQLSYEGMKDAGSGLGSASFNVLGNDDDPLAVAAGVSRFLAIESCGQCTPCKQDGLEIAGLLSDIAGGRGKPADLERAQSRLGRVADGARCNLAVQHQVVVSSLLDCFPESVRMHLRAETEAAEPALIAELVGFSDGTAVVDTGFPDKQPDWTFADHDSGQTPADRLGEHRA